MSKLAPSDLAQVLGKLPKQNFTKKVLVGFETSDDAGVYQLTDEIGLVQTVDIFTPVADEPEIYGKVAAINSLNDVYAMGGLPLTALSIVCYPQKGDWNVLGEIMAGGQKTLNENGVVVLGGHSVDDQEIKFGYAITGIINPKKIIKNSGAKKGDVLILTKPIGTGVIITAIKYEKAKSASKNAAINIMTKSAREASKEMQEIGVNACTDVTGFGFLGHSFEMAKASSVTLEIESDKIPLLPDVLNLIEQKMLTRGDKNNREYVGNNVNFDKRISNEIKSALFDPQTAGGLLISMDEEKANRYIEKIKDAEIIGRVKSKGQFLLEVV